MDVYEEQTSSREDHPQGSDNDPERPSFESWWKRSKDVLKKRKITFVQAGSGSQAGDDQDASSSQTPQDKAKARRAQVRRAQIEHRQRKANYVKQLEIDVARIRDMIAATQMESRVLQTENNAMRSQLVKGSMIPVSMPPAQQTTPAEIPEPIDPSLFDSIQLDSLYDDTMTLSLGLDEAMHLPVYQVRSESTSSNCHPNAYFKPGNAQDTATPSYPFAHLSPEQTDQIINFILALEHICWDHFLPSSFHPETAQPFGTESGHVLMASSLALRTAPGAVFDYMRAQPPFPEAPPSAHAALLVATAETGAPPPPPISWPASGLTLHSLYGLASSVNPSDLDLAPVQAWFELAARYSLDILLRRDVEDRLKREFVGVVKCPHYGAAIERGTFESICARVLEPEVAALG